MRILDHTSDVRQLVETALAAVDRVLPQFTTSYPEPARYLNEGARDLIGLMTELYHLRRFARTGAPHIADLGGFGTGLDDSDAPTIMSAKEGKETWDFQPWLAEKLQSAERLLFRVFDICLLPPDFTQHPRWRRVVRDDNPGAECVRLLGGVQACLQGILGLIESGELRINQLSGIDDDDDDDED